jgi:HD superfamily phosphodiesterase
MLPPQQAAENQLGRSVAAAVPASGSAPAGLPPSHDAIWRLAAPYLAVRNNDEHTIYAYGIAHALTELHPEADPEVVLPAILLHDTGWSQAPQDEVLDAIAPGGGRPDLVLLHEKEGARIAHDVLAAVGHDPGRSGEIIEIIDGHDSRLRSLSLNDSLVKDADKLWRLTPHGIGTVMNWFGLSRDEARRLVDSRVHDHLFTDAARTMARMIGAIARIDCSPQRLALA